MVWLLGGAALARIRCIVKLCRNRATGTAPTRRQPRLPKPTEAVEFDTRSTCWVGGLRLIPRYCSKYASYSTETSCDRAEQSKPRNNDRIRNRSGKNDNRSRLCSSAPHEVSSACFKRHNGGAQPWAWRRAAATRPSDAAKC